MVRGTTVRNKRRKSPTAEERSTANRSMDLKLSRNRLNRRDLIKKSRVKEIFSSLLDGDVDKVDFIMNELETTDLMNDIMGLSVKSTSRIESSSSGSQARNRHNHHRHHDSTSSSTSSSSSTQLQNHNQNSSLHTRTRTDSHSHSPSHSHSHSQSHSTLPLDFFGGKSETRFGGISDRKTTLLQSSKSWDYDKNADSNYATPTGHAALTNMQLARGEGSRSPLLPKSVSFPPLSLDDENPHSNPLLEALTPFSLK
mmetsp:Transcript_17553/g.31508  ORF Transcript_17553/g.31508 Transcript_17553/m.31508 type:complete len:255 (+) Transcript_17553:141-905(+)